MKSLKSILIFLFIIIYSNQKALAQKDGDSLIIGEYRTVHSLILGQDRQIVVHLPAGYSETDMAYPVIYKLHGYTINFFSHITGTIDMLTERGLMPEVIFVGVKQYGHPENVPEEVCPEHYEGRCSASKFLQFCDKELIPFIDANYRTQPFRMMMGSFECGVFGIYTLLNKPETFKAYLLNSPGRYGGSEAYLDHARCILKDRIFNNHFLYIVTSSEDNERMKEATQEFISELDTLQPEGLHWGTIHLTGDDVDDYTPYVYSRGVLRDLFSEYPCPPEVLAEGLEGILEHYKELTTLYGYSVEIPERVLDNLGIAMQRQRNTEEAERVFSLLVEKYPRSINGLFRLGELNRGLGRYDASIMFYYKALEIDPSIGIIRHRMEQTQRIIDYSAMYTLEKIIQDKGLEAASQKFEAIRREKDSEFYFDENEFNALGYRFVGVGDMTSAIQVFMWNVLLHPESANAYDSLAEAYMTVGEKEKAILNYEKSLALNPQNTNAIEMLKRLRDE